MNETHVSAPAVPVLRWHKRDTARREALQALWRQVAEEGWLDFPLPRVGIRVARACRTQLVVETAQSLAAALGERMPGADISIAEPDDGADEPVRLAGIATLELTVPLQWFDSFCLITVTGAGPDPVGRLHGALAAQAEPLRRLGNRVPLATLAYEAHRLGGSDLTVVCGEAARPDDAWWVVSPSDLAAELVLARACGLGAKAPFLSTIAAHELLPSVQESGDLLPPLGALAAGNLSVRVRASLATVAASGRELRRDARAFRNNLGKVPGFVRRRLAARRTKVA